MQELKIHGIYIHFKGDYYIVEGIGIHSETKEKYPNVKQEYRFQLQDIESVASKFNGE